MPVQTQKRSRAMTARERQRVKKVHLDFFDTLSDILTYVKMFLTVRESGGSPPPFHTIPPLLLQPGPSFSTV